MSETFHFSSFTSTTKFKFKIKDLPQNCMFLIGDKRVVNIVFLEKKKKKNYYKLKREVTNILNSKFNLDINKVFMKESYQ